MIAASLLLIAGAVTLLVIGLWQASSALLGASIAASVLAAVTLIVGARRTAAMVPGADPEPPEPALVSAPPAPEPGFKPAATEPAWEPARSSAAAPEFRAGAGTPSDDTQPLPAVVGEAVVGETASQGGRPDAGYGGGDYPDESFESYESPEDEETAPRNAPATIPAQPAGGSMGMEPRVAAPGEAAHTDEPTLDDEDPPDEPAPQWVSAADAARVGRMLTEVLVVDGRPRYHLPGCVHLLGRESEPLPVGEAIELGFTPCSLCEPDSALLADARRV